MRPYGMMEVRVRWRFFLPVLMYRTRNDYGDWERWRFCDDRIVKGVNDLFEKTEAGK